MCLGGSEKKKAARAGAPSRHAHTGGSLKTAALEREGLGGK